MNAANSPGAVGDKWHSRGQWFETTTAHHEIPAPRPFGLGAFAVISMVLVDCPPFALPRGRNGAAAYFVRHQVYQNVLLRNNPLEHRQALGYT